MSPLDASSMKTYSLDLRERMLDAVDRGMPRKEAVRTFKVSLATIKRYIKFSTKGMGAAMAIEWTTDKEVFEAYVEHFLAPRLEHGQVVIMDNLQAHKGERARELIEAREASVLFLPSHSPDLSP